MQGVIGLASAFNSPPQNPSVQIDNNWRSQLCVSPHAVCYMEGTNGGNTGGYIAFGTLPNDDELRVFVNINNVFNTTSGVSEEPHAIHVFEYGDVSGTTVSTIVESVTWVNLSWFGILQAANLGEIFIGGGSVNHSCPGMAAPKRDGDLGNFYARNGFISEVKGGMQAKFSASIKLMRQITEWFFVYRSAESDVKRVY